MHSLVWIAVVRTLNIYAVDFHQSKVNACAGSIFDLLLSSRVFIDSAAVVKSERRI